ncbi:MAG: hypothetical protein OXC11_06640 [Rhodospirillales bacterium]|nr:hypothetical protein [Rhodospirillales bacterium]
MDKQGADGSARRLLDRRLRYWLMQAESMTMGCDEPAGLEGRPEPPRGAWPTCQYIDDAEGDAHG